MIRQLTLRLRPSGAIRLGEKEMAVAYPFLMLYMRVLALAGVSVKRLFGILGSANDIIGPASEVFRRLDLLVNKWGYNSVRAIRYVANLVGHGRLKALLDRLAYSLSIGVPYPDFAAIEYEKYLLEEEREVDQRMDRLRLYSEAYSAILNANTLIATISVVVSMMFGAADPVATLIAVLMTMAVSTASILALFKATVPARGEVIHRFRPMPQEIGDLLVISRPAIAISIATVVMPTLMAAMLMSRLPVMEARLKALLNFILPLTHGTAGATLFAIGLVGCKRVSAVDRLDQLYMIFLKTLGEATAIAGSLREGVKRIVHNDYKELNPFVRRLYMRLKLGIDYRVAWRVTSLETGSSVIARYSGIYVAALRVGSPPAEVATILHDAINRELVLRRKRAAVANYLKGLVVPLQAVFTAIFTLIATLTSIFYNLSKLISGYLTVQLVNVPNPLVVTLFLFVGAMVLTVGNSTAIYVLKGDSVFTLVYYLGLLLLISGCTYLALSHGLTWVFSMFAGFEKGVREVGP